MSISYDGPPPTDESQMHAAIKAGIAAVQRADFPAALRLFRAIYEPSSEGKPPGGLSYYGLCLARVEKKRKRGADLCRKAIHAQFYVSAHYANLIEIYLQAKNRKQAVKALEEGLSHIPGDSALLGIRDRMRYRAPSPVGFVHRDHFLNQIFGRLRYRPRVVLAMKIGVGLTLLALSVGGTMWFLLAPAS